MTKYADILVIKGDWDGGNHGSYPKILSVNPDLDRPFSITEGWGHGLGGGIFTLKELVEKKFLEVFNRIESQAIYDRLVSEHSLKKDGKRLAAELLAQYGENA